MNKDIEHGLPQEVVHRPWEKPFWRGSMRFAKVAFVFLVISTALSVSNRLLSSPNKDLGVNLTPNLGKSPVLSVALIMMDCGRYEQGRLGVSVTIPRNNLVPLTNGRIIINTIEDVNGNSFIISSSKRPLDSDDPDVLRVPAQISDLLDPSRRLFIEPSSTYDLITYAADDILSYPNQTEEIWRLRLQTTDCTEPDNEYSDPTLRRIA